MKCDFKGFKRANQLANLGLGKLSASEGAFAAHVRAQLKHGIPSRVPLAVLRSMDDHPMVYLAERTITGVLRRPDLYYVRHDDPGIKREVEEWLWPILPRVLSAVARAYAYGVIPVVFNWGEEDLHLGDHGLRRRHVHYVSAHEVWPGDVQIDSAGDELVALRYGKHRYSAERAAVFVWDREFGGWRGKAARRRAWTDYCRSLNVHLLQLRYLERSVDPPRVAYAPPGYFQAEGQEQEALGYVATLLTNLKGGGTAVFPSSRDDKNNLDYAVDLLGLPDRQAVWEQALNRYDAGILRAYLVPPRLGGLDDMAAGGARTLDGMLKEFVQDLAQFAADELTRLVTTVHRYNHSERRVSAPEVLAYEVPASVRKLYLEVLRLVSAAQREEAPADWVDVPALLDQLGVPLRSKPLPPQPARGAPGRPRDLVGDREARREAAHTEEGESSVGRRTV